MVNILLGILKGIGILLAVVLSLLLLAILLVLLGPICYRASGRYRDDKAYSAGVSWLGFVLRAKADYEESRGLLWGVRLFGILIASNEEEFIRKKEEKNRVKEERERKKALKKQEKAAESFVPQEELPETENLELPENPCEEASELAVNQPEGMEDQAVIPEPDQEEEPLATETLETEGEQNALELEGNQNAPAQKKRVSEIIAEKLTQIKKTIINLIRKIKSIPEKIRNLIGNIKNKIEAIKAKIARIMEFKEFFLGERNREGFLHVLKNLKKMALHILPRKLEGTVEFGVEDPYTMGQILTVLSIFYPVYQDKFTVRPDFENPGFAGEASLKGRIIPGYLVLRLLIAVCNREVIRIIKEGRQLIGGNKA